MKKIIFWFAIGMLFALLLAFLSAPLHTDTDIIDIGSDGISSDFHVSTDVQTSVPGTTTMGPKTTTVYFYNPDGSSFVKTTTDNNPSVYSSSTSSSGSLEFCDSVVKNYSFAISGLSVSNDGDVVESEGDIPAGSGLGLVPGGVYHYYVVKKASSSGGVTYANCEYCNNQYVPVSGDGGYCSTNCSYLSNNGACSKCGAGIDFNGKCPVCG